MNTTYKILLLLCVSCLNAMSCMADSKTFIVANTKFNQQLSKTVYSFVDESRKMAFEDVVNSNQFKKEEKQVPNFGTISGNVWLRFTIYNPTNATNFSLEVENALLDEVTLYDLSDADHKQQTVSKRTPFYERNVSIPNPLFKVFIPTGEKKTYYMKVQSNTQILVPIKLGTNTNVINYDYKKDALRGIYFGIIIALILYNIFLYASLGDESYLYYVLYMISVAFVQLNITGWGFKYFWYNSPDFERFSLYLFPAFTAFASIGFARRFLTLKQYSPRINKVLYVIIALYVINIGIAYWGNKILSYNLTNVLALPLAFLLIWIGFDLWFRNNYRPGLFFLIGWSFFLLSVIGFVLKDYSILPYNLFTSSLLQIGSASVGILLSIALADKINILQDETRRNQKLALLASQENERIVREQNVMLEKEVDIRTKQLQETNTNLEQTLQDLKDAELQLVESEKMSSLGQLTAGIAHEINNPINFVTSNVKPLKRDIEIIKELFSKVESIAVNTIPDEEKKQQIEALKEEADFDYLSMEMDHLLKGIGEGASRTAEIVKGLRVFSRLDEDDIKLADLNDGLDSTLVIVNNLLGNTIELEKKYAELPLVECYPGKLNQVFLNIITNAIHAIKERWKEDLGGKLVVSTTCIDYDVSISIKDNGTGMTEETKKKLFEPFFTTKEVGVGTGLGLSIAWNTIKKHNGQIQVNSEVGVGTEFVLTIPIKYTEQHND